MGMNAQLNTMIRMALADLGRDAQIRLPRETDKLRRMYQALELEQAFTPKSALKQEVKDQIIHKNRHHLESATRGLRLTEMSDDELVKKLKAYKPMPAFAAKVIYGAVIEEMARRVVEELRA